MLRTAVCLPYHQHPLLPNGIGGPNLLGTFTVRLFHGGHTKPVEQFNVVLRTRATGAVQLLLKILAEKPRRCLKVVEVLAVY